MKIKYDEEADAIYVISSDDRVVESEQKNKNVILDNKEKDEVVAIEILHVTQNEHEIYLPITLKIALSKF